MVQTSNQYQISTTASAVSKMTLTSKVIKSDPFCIYVLGKWFDLLDADI